LASDPPWTSWGATSLGAAGSSKRAAVKGVTERASCHVTRRLNALLNLQSPYDTTVNRFAWVLEHELGHMLALAHKDNTMMNSQYDRHFNSFDPLQITYIRDTLKILSP